MLKFKQGDKVKIVCYEQEGGEYVTMEDVMKNYDDIEEVDENILKAMKNKKVLEIFKITNRDTYPYLIKIDGEIKSFKDDELELVRITSWKEVLQ
jgi:hypothetical protein